MAPDLAIGRRAGLALLALRLALGAFLLQWTLLKFVIPSAAIGIARYFYGVEIGEAVPIALGVAEFALVIAILLGAFRRVAYGAACLIHSASVLVSWRQLLDPFGFIAITNRLFFAGIPILAAFILLYALRDLDVYSLEAWRRRRGQNAGRPA